jgi:hypothetical protein
VDYAPEGFEFNCEIVAVGSIHDKNEFGIDTIGCGQNRPEEGSEGRSILTDRYYN